MFLNDETFDFSDSMVAELAEMVNSGFICYIHLKTKKIKTVLIADDGFDYDDEDDLNAKDLREIEEDRINFAKLDKPTSREGYEIMEEFAQQVSNRRAQEALYNALDGRRPFRNFKDTVDRYGAVRQEWFAFRDKAQKELVERQLQKLFRAHYYGGLYANEEE